jgi:hypothetical protein
MCKKYVYHAEDQMKGSWNAEQSIGKEEREEDALSFSFFLLSSS